MPLITYTSSDPDDPTRGYGRWLCDMMMNHGFDVPKPEIVKILNASTGFIHTVQKSVDYIRVNEGALKHSIEDEDVPGAALKRIVPQISIYYNRQQMHDWLLNTPTYTRKTRRAPLIEAYGGDVAAVEKHLQIIAKMEELQEKMGENLKDPAIAEALDKALEDCQKAYKKHVYTNCPQHKLVLHSLLRRGTIPDAPVQPFEWWKQEHGSAFSAAAAVRLRYQNNEALYREMYLSAAVKITFGTRKTFFYIPPLDDPHTLLIPATPGLI